MKRYPILIVSSEAETMDSLLPVLEGCYEVFTAVSAQEGLGIIRREAIRAMLIDPRMPEVIQGGLLEEAASLAPNARLLLIKHEQMDPQMEALNTKEFYGYIPKIGKPDELRMSIQRAVESCHMAIELEECHAEIFRLNQELDVTQQRLMQEGAHQRKLALARYQLDGLFTQSRAMGRIYDLIERVLHSDVTVLLLGETGTGKDLLARYIYYNGSRRNRPFIAQNCGALPPELLESEPFGHRKGAFTGASEDRPGLFEAAEGGTIFLDEISDTSAAMQMRLLRVLQDGELRRMGETTIQKVDVRVIAATNRDLLAEVKTGQFREDLYFRVNVFPIKLPPLRDRPEEVPMLALHFLKRFAPNREVRISPEAMDLLCRHDWPGNVRELKNEMQRALLLIGKGNQIGPEFLSESVRGSPVLQVVQREGQLSARLADMEREIITEALKRYGGNRTRAAQELRISRWGLVQKIKKYGITGK